MLFLFFATLFEVLYYQWQQETVSFFNFALTVVLLEYTKQTSTEYFPFVTKYYLKLLYNKNFYCFNYWFITTFVYQRVEW